MSVSSRSPSPAAAAPPALSAFLRGVERRGAVLAELQAGDAVAGDAALAEAMRQFRTEAETVPMAQWPGRFWAGLLAQPQLRRRTEVALPLDATDRLGELGSGPRAALLLRLAAGLSEDEAATALGVAQPSYRLALQRALPHHADGRADPVAWQRLREQVHRRIKTLPPDRLVRLSNAREAALHGEPRGGAGATTTPAAGRAPRPRWLLPLLWGLLLLCVTALAVTFWWPSHWPLGPVLERLHGGASGARQVSSDRLPAAEEPAARYGRETALIAHRDFALLADPPGEAAAADLEFHSWLAAQQAAGVTAPDATALAATAAVEPAVPAAAPTEATGSETETETDDAPQ
ncbi:hypothetical protein ACFOLC_06370 [Lysobacter cavernae]|uniref:RNA polymerase sigma factor 70 region 4 type 2 domain-containing protein n=1 Tax=Lysobacter cavernae TaxID=1685901 RepID=A0ABV7RLY1_9GAMM